ncbi:MAG TPA: rRNA adenine N-6-methyltransferase family protein [Acidimicrobiales bacterium]|nr:rRNA adenine N-6-methyltransferase family protein [Acidimicrobiales bacterium]
MAGTRRWGWHQLSAPFAEALVAEAAIPRGSTVVDIGAGSGALTAPLVRNGLRVVAVEAHRERAAQLRATFRGTSVIVVQADAAELRLPKMPYYVVANPPFAITAAVLRRLLQPGSRLVAARIILQHQAARRWVSPAAPAAARWQRMFEATLGRSVPRKAFSPPPPVDARVLVIERRQIHRDPG